MRAIILFALATLPLLYSGCSSNTASTSAGTAEPTKASRPASTPADAAAAGSADATAKSVFTVNANSRDPFFPNARRVEMEGQSDVALDIPAILQANLHGIISSGGKSIAYVSNVMLEPGRNALIPIRAGGQERQISVRCRDVTKESVVLEIQGYPEPVTLSRVAQ